MTSLELAACQRAHEGTSAPAAAPEPESEDLTPLGKARDIDFDDIQQVRDEAERLKCQKKDLKVIKEVFQKFATIRAAVELHEKEIDWLNECRRYVSLVVDKRQEGRARRLRMQGIRERMEVHIGKIDPKYLPDDEAMVRDWYEDLLSKQPGCKNRALMIDEALEIIDEEVENLSIRREQHKASKGKARKREPRPSKSSNIKVRVKKQVRFANDVEDENGRIRRDIPDGTVIDLDGPPGPKLKPKKPTKDEREIKELRERLKVFEPTEANKEKSASRPSSTHRNDDSASAGEESEEELGGIDSNAGSSFTSSRSFSRRNRSARLDVDQDIDEINRLEDERQRNEQQAAVRGSTGDAAPRSRQSSQLFDPSLITLMRKKYQGDEIPGMTAIGDGEEVEFADWTDSESTAPSDSESSDSSFDATAQIYKYTVKGRFQGVAIYSEKEEMISKSFHDIYKASQFAQEWITSLSGSYGRQHGQNYELHTVIRDGMQEQLAKFGKNREIQARVWVDRELVEIDVGKAAISKAKKRQLVNERDLYIVTWEKTIITTTYPSSSASSSTQADDLFGTEPPPAPATSTITEQCPREDEQLHFDLGQANLMAKEDFMVWYSQFFPENERKLSYVTKRGKHTYNYSGMLRQIDQAHEERLRVLGVQDVFEVEEEIERTELGEADTAAADEQGVGKRVIKERMKMYVRATPVAGPSN